MPEIDNFILPKTDSDVVANYQTLASRAKEFSYGILEEEFVIFDTETTGFNAHNDALIQIAATIMFGGEIVSEFSTFINPNRSIPEHISELTGIYDEDVRDAPTLYEAMRLLVEFAGARRLVAHNANFDYEFIKAACEKLLRNPGARDDGTGAAGDDGNAASDNAGDWMDEADDRRVAFEHGLNYLSDKNNWLDSMTLAKIALPRLKAHDMRTLYNAFETFQPSHKADDDVRALCSIWRIILCALADLPKPVLAFIASLAPDSNWSLRSIIIAVLGVPIEKVATLDMKKFRQARIKEFDPLKIQIDDTTTDAQMLPAIINHDELKREFDKGGLVSQMYPTYEYREVQLEYASEVASAFSESTHRVIEAGTGVGKSISYLLPAVLFAKRNKTQFGVATKTNSLLDQLACNEIPKLSQAYLEKYGAEISSVEIKGFDHYPCLRKLWRYRNATDIDDTRELDAVAMVISSVAQSIWMDLDDLSIAWRGGVIRQITCGSEECLKSHCRFFPNECYVRGLRRRAANADVVLTNHSFLFRDITNPRGISRQIKHWIIDEAHCVEDEARSQLSFKFKESDLKYATGELSAPTKGILKTVEKIAMADSDFNNLESASKFLLTLSLASQYCEELNVLLPETISRLLEVLEIERIGDDPKKYRNENIWFSLKHREKPEFAALESSAGELLSKLNSLVISLRDIITGVEKLESATQVTTELSAMADRLYEMMTSISYFIAGEEENLFYSVEIKGYPSKIDITMNSWMLNVGEALAEIFYPEMSSIIFTSATIAVADSFDYFCSLCGLDKINSELWSAKQLQSSYDFDNNMEILVASDIGDPRSPNYIEEVAKLLSGLILKLNGGVLALFTNRTEMQKVHAIVKEKLVDLPELKLLSQQSLSSKRRLQEDFVQDERASLFALKSFWEGFDAPGTTLRCVVIVKIPFSRPDEPLSRERETRESNAWSRYTLPQAIIETKQAAGRLIRSHTDEGYLVFGDSRLLTKHYGKKVIASMPSKNVKVLDVESIIDGVF